MDTLLALAVIAACVAVVFNHFEVSRLRRRCDGLQKQISDLWDRFDPAA